MSYDERFCKLAIASRVAYSWPLLGQRRRPAFYVADPLSSIHPPSRRLRRGGPIHTNMIMLKALILALLTVVASSAVAAEDGPEEVIRALYKAHRPWEHKELNLGNRAVLSKYFSPELTKLFLKNAQLERDCPKGDLCGLDFDPILGAQDFDDHLNFKLRITEATPPQTGRFEARFKLFNDDQPEQISRFPTCSVEKRLAH